MTFNRRRRRGCETVKEKACGDFGTELREFNEEYIEQQNGLTRLPG
jgi:hypothetical protein